MLAPVQLTVDEISLLKQHFHGSQYEITRLKAQAVLLNFQGYSFSQVSQILDTSEETVYRFVKDFTRTRIASLFPRSLGNQHAAKLTRSQKQNLAKVLAKPPSEFDIPARFWDISALKKYLKAELAVEYESLESYRLLLLLHNYSYHLPQAFDRRRDEKKIVKRIKAIKKEIKPFLTNSTWLVFAADECRIVWETEMRRLWLPKGEKTVIKVERKRQAQSFLGFLDLKSHDELLFKLAWQKTSEIVPVLEELIKAYPGKHLCIIWDNARFHHSKELKKKLSTTLKNIHLINLPPYAPDHNPQEHVWKYGKSQIANHQHDSLEETVATFVTAVTGRKYQYEFS